MHRQHGRAVRARNQGKVKGFKQIEPVLGKRDRQYPKPLNILAARPVLGSGVGLHRHIGRAIEPCADIAIGGLINHEFDVRAAPEQGAINANETLFAPDGRSLKQVAFKPTRTASLDGTSQDRVSRGAAEERFFLERLDGSASSSFGIGRSSARLNASGERRRDPVPERRISENARPVSTSRGRSDSRWRPGVHPHNIASTSTFGRPSTCEERTKTSARAKTSRDCRISG